MSAKHTPAPWSAIDLHDHNYRIESTCSALIAEVFQIGIETKERIPNALLIAAAPDLLAACKSLVSRFKSGSDKFTKARAVIEMAEAAIAKAEGTEVISSKTIWRGETLFSEGTEGGAE